MIPDPKKISFTRLGDTYEEDWTKEEQWKKNINIQKKMATHVIRTIFLG